jgi:hypothetical protein
MFTSQIIGTGKFSYRCNVATDGYTKRNKSVDYTLVTARYKKLIDDLCNNYRGITLLRSV